MSKTKRNNFIDKIIFLIRAEMLELKEEEKDKMIEKMKKICNEILEKELNEKLS